MKRIFKIQILFLSIATSVFASEIKTVNFKQNGEISVLEFNLDKDDVVVNKFQVTDDKQIIIDFKDTTVGEKAGRAFDTSEFSGGVVFINMYKKPNSKDDLRVAVQLRENVRSTIEKLPRKVVIKIENRFGAFSQKNVDEGKSITEAMKGNGGELGKINIPKSDSLEDLLENLTQSGRKKYSGKKISINVREVAVEDILKTIADSSGFNVIMSNEISGLPKLSLNLTNVEWDQCLDTILALNRLVATRNGSILMITTLAKATEEKKLEIEAKNLTKKQEPFVTKVFSISFSDILEIEKILKDYLTLGEEGKSKGSIALDQRTNSVIVKDTADVIERMKKIIEVLDTQTPQILIESKIVEVNESNSKEIGLKNGVTFGYDPIENPNITGVTDSGPGFTFSTAPQSGGRSFMGLQIARMSRLINLDFTLQLMEQESKGKVISSPKIVTLNKKTATITSTDQRNFLVSSSSGSTTAGSSANSSISSLSADLSLEVTPQVTNEGSISMVVKVAKSDFGTQTSAESPPPQTKKNVSTNVLVDNGSTIVIGGIYSFSKSESHSGIPFLKDIPLIGWLFRTPFNPNTSKTELIIFLTPRIINQEEAGLVDTES
jgi:type IV pilus assembly protein PilQ